GARFAGLGRGANKGRCAVHGFDHRIVSRLGLGRPGLARGVLLSSYPIRPLEVLEDTGATTLWEEHGMIDPALVDTVQSAGYRVFAWTVNEDDEMRRLVALGVDGICTNYPDVARRAVVAAAIASGMRRPGRLVGMHFFNPVPAMKLVEVVAHAGVNRAAVDQAVELARAFGKEPIIVQDAPGFASSRLGVVLGLEAMRMLEQGVASAEDIDKAMELGYNHPMGPLKLTDLVGLDVRLAIA